MTLVEAIGKILDSNDRPMSLVDLVDVINGGYFEIDDYEDVDEENVEECVGVNQKLFDLRNGFVSIKGQKYSEKQLWEITDRLRGEFGSGGYDLFILMLFYFRFNAIKEELDLVDPYDGVQSLLVELKLPNNELGEYEFLDPFESILFENCGIQINDFEEDRPLFEIHKVEVLGTDSLPRKFYQLLSNYDWSLQSISKNTFDQFLQRVLQNLVHRRNDYGSYLPSKLSTLISKLIGNGNFENVLDLNSQLGELTSQFYRAHPGDYSIAIAHVNPRYTVLSALRLILLGVKKIRLLQHAFLANPKQHDLLITNPPWGRLTKKYWEETPGFENIKARSLEELFVKIGFSALQPNGEAYIIVPDGFLFRGNSFLKKFRKSLTKNRNLKCIISLPRSVFGNIASVNTSVLVLSKSGNESPPFFINGREIALNRKDFYDVIYDLYRGKKEEAKISRFVTWEEIENEDYNFDSLRYFNPKVYSDIYQREDDEKILSLSEVTNRLKLPRKEVDGSYPLMNMSNLADDSADYVLDISNRSTKSEYNSKLMVLDRDAVLIGKVGNKLKPSLFKYDRQPIYVGKNVIALEPNKDVDPEYLISELNSEFVGNQIKRLPKGSTIPNIRIKDLMNLYIRVPNLNKQAALFKDWIKKVAKSRVAEIENISSRLKLVEKDILSGFKHDFMQILGNVSSGLNNISNYIHSLSERNAISLEDPVTPQFPGEEVKPEETIKSTLERVRYNVQSAIDFLEVEMDRLVSGVDKSNFKQVEFYQFLKEWKHGVNIYNSNSIRIEKNKSRWWPSKGITVSLAPALFKTVLSNLLNNAIRHGFTENKSDYEFVLSVGLIEESEDFFARLLIMNNGKPFPDGYSFEDFVTTRTSTGKNRGTGLGGAQVKRIIEEHGGQFRRPENSMSVEMWPVQFEILIPIVEE